MDFGGFQSFVANNGALSNAAQMETPRNIAAGSRRGNCMGNLIDTVQFPTVGAPISNRVVSVFPGWAGGGGGRFSKGGPTWPLGQLGSLGPQGPARGGNTGCLRAESGPLNEASDVPVRVGRRRAPSGWKTESRAAGPLASWGSGVLLTRSTGDRKEAAAEGA